MRNAIILILILFCSCSGVDRPKKPDNLIKKDKMVNILYDVYMMNATKGLKKRDLENWGISPEKYILEKYDIDSLQFAQSNDYYAYDTELYQGFMAEIVERLETKKEKYEQLRDSLRKAKKQRKDSISQKKSKIKEQKLKKDIQKDAIFKH